MFTGVAILKHAIIDYVMELKKDIWFSKNDLKWVQAKSRPNCYWYLYARKIDVDGTFQLRHITNNTVAFQKINIVV